MKTSAFSNFQGNIITTLLTPSSFPPVTLKLRFNGGYRELTRHLFFGSEFFLNKVDEDKCLSVKCNMDSEELLQLIRSTAQNDIAAMKARESNNICGGVVVPMVFGSGFESNANLYLGFDDSGSTSFDVNLEVEDETEVSLLESSFQPKNQLTQLATEIGNAIIQEDFIRWMDARGESNDGFDSFFCGSGSSPLGGFLRTKEALTGRLKEFSESLDGYRIMSVKESPEKRLPLDPSSGVRDWICSVVVRLGHEEHEEVILKVTFERSELRCRPGTSFRTLTGGNADLWPSGWDLRGHATIFFAKHRSPLFDKQVVLEPVNLQKNDLEDFEAFTGTGRASALDIS